MRRSFVVPSVALCLLSGVAAAQPAPTKATPPAVAPAAPPPAAAPAAEAPAAASTEALLAAGTEPPKSQTQMALEAQFHAMRSGQGLTADDVARRAVASSAQLDAKRAAVAGTEASISATKYAFWPKLTGTAGYTRLSHIYPRIPLPTPTTPEEAQLQQAQIKQIKLFAPDMPNVYSFGARLSVPLSDYLIRLSDAVRGASRSREAARADEDAVRASVARDARVAYYQWVQAQARELIALQGLDQNRAHLSDAQHGFEAGLLSKADVLGAEARVKGAELFCERTKNAKALAELSLRVAMHDTGTAQYAVGEDIFAEAPELAQLPTTDAAYREALGARAELRSLGALGEALRSQASTEAAGAYPRLDASAGAAYANPNQRHFPPEEKFHGNWDVGVVLSWTPTDIGGASATSSATEAKAKELDAQARALRDGLKLEVEQAIRAAEEARFSITATHLGLVAAEESYRVRRELYRAGRSTTGELTDAETDLTSARLQMADSHVSARIALAELRHALGRDQKAPGTSAEASAH